MTTADSLTLKAKDGHVFSAYRARPAGEPLAGLVVVQEIFGVNRHIRRVADRWAEAGYLTLAPALFDRIERGLELTYDAAGVERGRAVRGGVSNDQALADIGAAIDWLAAQKLKVFVIGFCWGGTLAWLSAARLPISGVSSFYGGGIGDLAAKEKPKTPIQLHFGEKDSYIPETHRAAARAGAPGADCFVYPADHGFCCDERSSYDAPSAALSFARSQIFFQSYLK